MSDYEVIEAIGKFIILKEYVFPEEEKNESMLIIPEDKNAEKFYRVVSAGLDVYLDINEDDIVCLSRHPLKMIFKKQELFFTTDDNIVAVMRQD